MIYSMVVNLQPEHDAEISANLGHHALALFLSLIRCVDEPLAQRLHFADGHKPFTVSPLQGKFGRRKASISIRSGAPCWLRFTALDEMVFARLMDSMLKGEPHVHLDNAAFRVTDVITHPQGSPWAGFASCETMLEQAAAETRISLHFTSPTVFRSAGKRNVAFPSPEMVFGSLLIKWNAFSENKLDSSLIDTVGKSILVSRYKLETKMLDFGGYQELGFIGGCEYVIKDRVPEKTLKNLNALTDFAFFCGTGAKTTMGMGQTRRLNYARAVPGGARSHLEKTG